MPSIVQECCVKGCKNKFIAGQGGAAKGRCPMHYRRDYLNSPDKDVPQKLRDPEKVKDGVILTYVDGKLKKRIERIAKGKHVAVSVLLGEVIAKFADAEEKRQASVSNRKRGETS